MPREPGLWQRLAFDQIDVVYNDTEPCRFESFLTFIEISRKVLILSLKIKYFLEVHFSQKLIVIGFFTD